jgi:hypothetical protein
MASELAGAKTPPGQVAEQTLQGIREGVQHVRADKRSEETWDSVRKDPEGLEKSMPQAWDNRQQ